MAVNNNKWNAIIPGITQGLGSMAKGYFIDKPNVEEAQNLYNTGLNALYGMKDAKNNNLSSLKEELLKSASNDVNVIHNNEQVGVGLNIPFGNEQPNTEEQKYSRVSNPQGNTNELSSTYQNSLMGLAFNPYGQPLAGQLQSLYKNIHPEPKWAVKEVNGQLVYVDESNPNQKPILSYGNPKPDQIKLLSGEERYIKDGDKYYKEYPTFNDTKGEIGKPQRIEVTEKEYNKAQDKLMTTEETLSLREKYRPKPKGSRGSAPPPPPEVQKIGTALTKLGEYNKLYGSIFDKNGNPIQGKEQEAENYKLAKDFLAPYFKGNYDAMNKYAEDLFTKGGGKVTTQMVKDLLKQSGVDDAEIENLLSIGEDSEDPETYDTEINYFDSGLDELETGEQMSLWLKDFESKAKSNSAIEYAREKYLDKVGNPLRKKQKNRSY